MCCRSLLATKVANDGVANDSVASDGVAGENAGFLGDIALARETCVREAADKNIALSDHAAHLIIHAMLNLVGYDHQADDEAALMERRETEILASMGVSDPYGL